jgi:hypothetical protein
MHLWGVGRCRADSGFFVEAHFGTDGQQVEETKEGTDERI